MELRTEIKRRLRESRNWLDVIDQLEHEAEQGPTDAEKSQRFFELAETCDEVLLQKNRAMQYYQRALKLNRANAQALGRLRDIYEEMGNLDMVAKLLELEMKVSTDAGQRAHLQGLLGRARLDLRQREQAMPHLVAAANARPDDQGIAEALAVALADAGNWLQEAERLQAEAETADTTTAARLLLRVARILALEVPDDPAYEETLKRVLANDPQNVEANFLLEQHLALKQRMDEIADLHEKRAFAVADEHERAALYRTFASLWALRWNDEERMAGFYRKALESYYSEGVEDFPGHLAAFNIVRQILAVREEWDEAVELCSMALAVPNLPPEDGAVIATAGGLIAWRELHDENKARAFFRRVAAVAPESLEVQAFEKEHGAVGGKPAPAPAPEPAPEPEPVTPPPVKLAEAPKPAPAPEPAPAPAAPSAPVAAAPSAPIAAPDSDIAREA
ncbi:MAG TPA: hypothetical protein VGQ83_23830, partial [Polyangia bacterium]